MKIQLFGTKKCHKTAYYKVFLETRKLRYVFLDIENNEENETKLRNLYKNKKLNFPTITIDSKKLRNPSDSTLQKWIDKKKR
jgi:arsenate reductase-like glutaredoxin family protein